MLLWPPSSHPSRLPCHDVRPLQDGSTWKRKRRKGTDEGFLPAGRVLSGTELSFFSYGVRGGWTSVASSILAQRTSRETLSWSSSEKGRPISILAGFFCVCRPKTVPSQLPLIFSQCVNGKKYLAFFSPQQQTLGTWCFVLTPGQQTNHSFPLCIPQA